MTATNKETEQAPRQASQRKVVSFMYVTLDGYHAGPQGEIDWHIVDEEMNGYFFEQLETMDTLIFGRATYEGMVSFWPTSLAIENDPIIADKMNTLPKVVFSTTLGEAPWGTWNNARVVKDHVVEEVEAMKRQPGKDMIIMGSGHLVRSFATLGLMDEYRIVVNPVILGSGQPFFASFTDRLNLKLLEARTFRCGNVLLRYQPDNH